MYIGGSAQGETPPCGTSEIHHGTHQDAPSNSSEPLGALFSHRLRAPSNPRRRLHSHANANANTAGPCWGRAPFCLVLETQRDGTLQANNVHTWPCSWTSPRQRREESTETRPGTGQSQELVSAPDGRGCGRGPGGACLTKTRLKECPVPSVIKYPSHPSMDPGHGCSDINKGPRLVIPRRSFAFALSAVPA
jgi:hypothetical protein